MADKPDSLIFPKALREELILHAREGAPAEVCGVVAGRENTVECVYRVRNIADTIHAEDRVFRSRRTQAPADGRLEMDYYMDPLEYGRVEEQIDAAGLNILGYYHSHTHTEARPSPRDVRLAQWLEVYYILVSLKHAESPEVRAWRIIKDSPTAEEGKVAEVRLA
jgi:proteasome lid subunit RPN8/RPN11